MQQYGVEYKGKSRSILHRRMISLRILTLTTTGLILRRIRIRGRGFSSRRHYPARSSLEMTLSSSMSDLLRLLQIQMHVAGSLMSSLIPDWIVRMERTTSWWMEVIETTLCNWAVRWCNNLLKGLCHSNSSLRETSWTLKSARESKTGFNLDRCDQVVQSTARLAQTQMRSTWMDLKTISFSNSKMSSQSRIWASYWTMRIRNI